jgi:rhomboid protease GluP
MTLPSQPPRVAEDQAPLLISEEMLAHGEPAERLDFEQGISYSPGLVLLLIAVITAVFGWEMVHGALASKEAIIAAGALVRERVLAGEMWRLLTATFLHGSPDHVVGNCIVLYIVGLACQHAFGWARTAVIYFGTALCGWLLSLASHAGPSVGASGAIFGITGATVVFFYRHQKAVMLRDKRIGFVLLIWALYEIGSGMLNPMVDNYAHLGGFAAGAMAALLLRPILLTRSLPPAATAGWPYSEFPPTPN